MTPLLSPRLGQLLLLLALPIMACSRSQMPESPDSSVPVDSQVPQDGTDAATRRDSGPPDTPVNPDCGNLDQICCLGNQCHGELACRDSMCVPCGDPFEPCCADDVCDDGATCNFRDNCIPCGGPDQPCCDGDCDDGGCCLRDRCTPAGAECPGQGSMCNDGTCGNCGGFDQPCCDGDCTNGDVACRGNRCINCGGFSEPCCPGDTCDRDNLTCDGSQCVSCGDRGESCCPGDTCDAPHLTCFDGRCAACGMPGQSCCPGDSCHEGCCDERSGFCVGDDEPCANDGGRCTGGECALCGYDGQPCCDGTSCADGACCVEGMCQRPGTAVGDDVCFHSEVVACGGPGQPCCEHEACGDGGCCVYDRCIANGDSCALDGEEVCLDSQCVVGEDFCGGPGQPCCDTAQFEKLCTAPGLVCRFNTDGPQTCEACGGPGQLCCAGGTCGDGGCCVDNRCVGDGSSCGDGRGLCEGGGCASGTCGMANQECCPDTRSGQCTGAFTICVGRWCQPWGTDFMCGNCHFGWRCLGDASCEHIDSER